MTPPINRCRRPPDIEAAALLHNTGVPPKTVVRYTGLGGLATHSNGSTPEPAAFEATGVFGTPVRFVLPAGFMAREPRLILRALDVAPARDPLHRLEALINARAAELPLPDGCVVIPVSKRHPVPWPDPLSALAVLAKSSDSIWLRDKTPSLHAALGRRQISLLVPPCLAARLMEAPS